jgi:hypothetical protein
VRQYSPDPEYRQKVHQVLECLRKTHDRPDLFAIRFLDEMGVLRWPEPAPCGGAATPAPPPWTDK